MIMIHSTNTTMFFGYLLLGTLLVSSITHSSAQMMHDHEKPTMMDLQPTKKSMLRGGGGGRGGEAQEEEQHHGSNIIVHPEVDDDTDRNLQLESFSYVISNGLIKLGVRSSGSLIAPGKIPSTKTKTEASTTMVGLRYIFPDGSGESEAIALGRLWEGWGVYADGEKAISTLQDFTGGDTGIDMNSIKIDLYPDKEGNVNARSSVKTVEGKLKVTHDFHAITSTPNLYEVTVTLKNTSKNTIADTRYRRVVDFDASPTPNSECITIQPDPSNVAHLNKATNSGDVYELNPAIPLKTRKPFTSAPFVDSGPADLGANFDFSFGSLDPGMSKTFNMYYGAAPNQNVAKGAILSVKAEVYAFVTPSKGDQCAAAPNVFIMAFSDVGGRPVSF